MVECELNHQKEVDTLREQCVQLKADVKKQKEVNEHLRKKLEDKGKTEASRNLEKELVGKKSSIEALSQLHERHRREVKSMHELNSRMSTEKVHSPISTQSADRHPSATIRYTEIYCCTPTDSPPTG